MVALQQLLKTEFIPQGHCIFWQAELLTLHVVSDLIIALAYFSIAVFLAFFVKKRADLALGGLFVLFAAFIIFSGVTHVLAIWNIWHANYYLEGGVKALTALLFLVTTIRAWPQVFKENSFLSPQALVTANKQLQLEIEKRNAVEAELRKTQENLEQRVAERTQELQFSKDKLELEINNRKVMEARF